jgi:hypothetical protein
MVYLVVLVPKPDGDIRLSGHETSTQRSYVADTQPPQWMNFSKELMGLLSRSVNWILNGGLNHQLERTPDITTFAVHNGTYRNKRLWSSIGERERINVTSQQQLASRGLENISDDIIVHVPDEGEP